ncbi:MAG TPA: hypothetical protein VHA77_14060 [Xanthobacteraceae bacterium]|nr:hypothetical protein [Xanthobacteraceae bacterium]
MKLDALPSIPLVDVREGGPVRHAREGRSRARALRDECLAWFPAALRPLVPVFDAFARHWMRRSCSPYAAEIEAIAAALGFPGVWFLNGSYQFCCTALAREEDNVPWLARTLDWPFAGLGRNAEIARMCGPAGEYFNITWPGYAGVLTAMAPGRFAVAINQAPLRRRTRHRWLRAYDIASAAVSTWMRVRDIPPDQLLRQVCETCATFEEARVRLETVPVARPVIFTLAGCAPGECCVIERTEQDYETRFEETAVANDWMRSREPWEARVGGDNLLMLDFAEAAANSRRRSEALACWDGLFTRDSFAWVTSPVLNPFTRIAVEMCPAKGLLRAAGYEAVVGHDLPQPVTQVREIAAVVG